MKSPKDCINSRLVEVRNSPVHNRGVFALASIPAGTRILEYLGERITKDISLVRCEAGNVYVFGLDDEFDLDGDVPENTARFINHSCAPNCEAVQEDDQVFIDAIRPIAPGEELSFNYGYDLEDYEDHPCRCGAPGCPGYIIAQELIPQLRSRVSGALPV